MTTLSTDKTCGEKKLKYGSGVFKMKVPELRTLVKKIYAEEKLPLPAISKSKREQLCDLLNKTETGRNLLKISVSSSINKDMDCKGLGGLSNINMSCYMDSILVALLYQPNAYINEKILYADLSKLNIKPEIMSLTIQIQEALKLITISMRSGIVTQCTNLRGLFHSYQIKQNELLKINGKKEIKLTNWLTAQKSASDVLSMLEKIFHMKQDVLISFKLIAANKTDKLIPGEYIVATDEKRTIDVIIQIDSSTLYMRSLLNQPFYLKNELNVVNITNLDDDNLYQHKYKVKIETKTIIDAPILIFSTDRNYLNTKPNCLVIPPKTIELLGIDPPKTKHKLNLSAVLVHDGSSPKGGHFRAYIKCGSVWYHYNDIGYTNLEFKGDFTTAILNNDYLLRNATQFIYY